MGSNDIDAHKRIKQLMESVTGRIPDWQREQTSPIPQLQICSIAVTLRLCRHWRLYAGRLALRCLSSLEDFEDNETLQEQRLLFSKWSTFTQEQRKILLDLMDIIK